MKEKKLHFKDFVKPLLVTLAIILVCGGLLAILSNVLFVSDQERVQRAIDKMYASSENVKLSQDLTEAQVNSIAVDTSKGQIKDCYILSNGDYLVLATGKQGYANGNITLYVAVSQQKVVKNVVLKEYAGQTLMSKLTTLYGKYNGLTPESEVNMVVSGATYSAKAANNAVETALQFVNQYIGG